MSQHACVLNYKLWNEEENQAASADVPSFIQLIPAGEVIEGRDGRTFKAGEFASIFKAFVDDQKDLPIDIEHSTDIKAPNGDPAPAVGWITSIESTDNGIWAHVNWNEIGKNLISTRQYRYISPVFNVNSETGEIVSILRAALTNDPNLKLKALNKKIEKNHVPEIQREVKMTVEKEESPMGETEEKKQAQQDDVELVPKQALDEQKAIAEEAAAVITELQTRLLKVETDYAIDKALRESKIAPSSEKHYRAMCSNFDGLERFKKFAESQKAIITTNFSDMLKQFKTVDEVVLTHEEKALCSKLKINEKSFLEQKRKNASAKGEI